MPIPGSRVRVLGSGFTVFHWNDGTRDQIIGFANEVRVAGVTPVADPAVIQPINALRPVEIATPGAHREGRITLVLTDLYNQAVWQRLSSLSNSNDIIDIFRTVAGMSNGITLSKIVTPPAGLANNNSGGPYIESYYECVIASVRDDETIRVETMTIDKEIELWYTYQRKHWINSPRDPSVIFA